MILSVLICSIPERKSMLNLLLAKFKSICESNEVEFLTDSTGRTLSIGSKRQLLLEKAQGKWIVFFDDDDWPNDNYINWILWAINNHPDIDCIGIRGLMTTNGLNPKTWCHRLGYKIEGNGVKKLPIGYDYIRPIIHFNPVLREKALQAGFKNMKYGEDMDYAKRLNPLLTKEYFIDNELFHYRYSTAVPHNKKYGIV